jgi:hypothetical protein
LKMSSMKKASLQEKKFKSKNEEASKNNKLKKTMAPTPKLRSFKVLDEDSHVAKYTAVSMALENLLEISVISTKKKYGRKTRRAGQPASWRSRFRGGDGTTSAFHHYRNPAARLECSVRM